MDSRSTVRSCFSPNRRYGLLGLALGLSALAGCSDDGERAPRTIPGGETPPGNLQGPCVIPNEGCACDDEGRSVDCGTVEAREGDDVICLEGQRTCTDGVWGACEGGFRTQVYAPLSGRGLHTLALAGTGASCNNVCTPECRTYADTPNGITVPPGFAATPTTLSLSPTGGLGGGACLTPTISPSVTTITVSQLSPLTSDKAGNSVTFTATCGASGPSISPTWSIGSADADVAAINRTTGALTIYAGVAKNITVTALTSLGTATATAQVRVNVDAGSTCSAAINTQFNNSPAAGDGGNVDPGQILYPYAVASRPVVFPQSFQAPLLQYRTGGRAASCVRVTMRYPANGSMFKWQRSLTNDPSQGTITSGQPSVTLDQTAWDYLGRSAEGQDAQIVVQRRTDSTVNAANPANKVMSEEIAAVHFATDALRGTVYYTQYVSQFRDPANSGTAVCSTQGDINTGTYPGTSAATGALASAGPQCPVGNCTHAPSQGSSSSMTRAVDIGSTSAPNRDPYGGTASCPVCHSVSANGSTYVAASDEWQRALSPVGPYTTANTPYTSRGIASIGVNASGAPVFTNIDESPYYSYRKSYPEMFNENSRGFSYAPITPDGSRVLQTANWWGNTVDIGASNTVQDATVRGITNKVKPYFLVKTANVGFGVQFGQTSALPAYTASGTTILNRNGGGGTLTVDGTVMAVDYSVLVAGETGGNQRYNGVYVVTSANPWQLTRRDDADASGDIKLNAEIRISDGGTNYGRVYYVSTLSGTWTPHTTATAYTQRVVPTFPSMMVPAISPDGTKIAYVNADADTISGQSTGWRRGLSMFTFDQSLLDTASAANAVTGKKRLLNTYSAGVPLKWPFFESDSRSLVYVETEAGEYCSSNALNTASADGLACSEASYGSMSPTTRARWKGVLYSLDTGAGTPSSTRRELSYINKNNSVANTGMDATDYDQAYQPTVLPFVAGGYRWVIFTSQRAYGNQFNQVGTHFTCASSLLWMAAIDDTTATAGTARDYPAFLVPGQKVRAINNTATNTTPDGNGEIGGQHYVNERGYLVPSPCKPVGTGTGSACTVSDECCGSTGSNPTAACRIDIPVTSPVTRHCTAISGSCSMANGSCSTDLDCCGNSPGNILYPCIAGQCSSPPTYTASTYTRDYYVDCPEEGYKVVWGDFRWHAEAAGNSTIVFSVKSDNTGAFSGSSVVIGSATSSNINVPPAAAQAVNVGPLLAAANVISGRYLRVSMAFNPTTPGGATAPILYDWEQRYSCVPSE
jgi:hypothetical protein